MVARRDCDGCALLTIACEELRASNELLLFRLSAVLPLKQPGGLAFIPIVARLRDVLTSPGLSDAERLKRIALILDEVAP